MTVRRSCNRVASRGASVINSTPNCPCVAHRTRATPTSMGVWFASDVSFDYTLSPDWDDRWRTGGNLDEVLEEAHLSPDWILRGIERFVRERKQRLARVRAMLEAAEAR